VPRVIACVDFLRLDVPTLNGRIYPTEVMRQAVAHAPAELPAFNHADDLRLDGVVGFVEAVRIEHGLLCGTVCLADTPCGLALQEIARLGGNIPLRPVGVGSLGEGQLWTVVQPDYRLTGFSLDPEDLRLTHSTKELRAVMRKKFSIALKMFKRHDKLVHPEKAL